MNAIMHQYAIQKIEKREKEKTEEGSILDRYLSDK